MAGFQFAHLSTFAAQIATKRRAAGGRTVRDILAEAGRFPGDCPHVHEPAPPTVLFGMAPADALAEHDRRRATAKKLMRGAGRGRGLRADTHTLTVAVLSHPVACADLDDPVALGEYMAWRTDALAWARQDLEKQGLEVLGAVEHRDERHPHLHVYGVPKDLAAFDARLGHPGHQAARSASNGSMVAYRTAMRGWQDDYHGSVGIVHGLARLGPGRRRLSRADWRREQAAAEAAAKALKRAQEATALAKAVEARAIEREGSSALLQAQATVLRDAAAADRGAAISERTALTTAVDAWASGEVQGVRLTSDQWHVGLVFAPLVPETRRQALVEALSPAWDIVCRVLSHLTEVMQAVPVAAREGTRHALAERWRERTRGPKSR